MTDADVMLTTEDNPFNPFTQFNEWYRYDTEKGYNTCSYLARIVQTSPDLGEPDQISAIIEGINEILEYNILGIYKKVVPSDFKDTA